MDEHIGRRSTTARGFGVAQLAGPAPAIVPSSAYREDMVLRLTSARQTHEAAIDIHPYLRAFSLPFRYRSAPSPKISGFELIQPYRIAGPSCPDAAATM
ncbi:hypothetical protein CP533_5987, partial [Ophiocordyceps camponoti-saundersi (nom. inval.)]